MSSSPPRAFSSLQEELAYYKAQYEHLEAELQDFQQSSRELEAELEKDVEASEKRERELRDKVDTVSFQADEWKTKYNQSRTDANTAQNNLQKEITALRESNRELQMKLRDMEVANDEYEIQARNTTTSLDDLESRYNQAIERNVLLEEEVKSGEQEREALRIESQRLKDELSDVKVENEIVVEKLKAAERAHIAGPPRVKESTHKRESSTYSDKSAVTTSTATTFSKPVKRSGVAASEPETPPSPALSDLPTRVKPLHAATTPTKSNLSNHNDTPRPEHVMQRKLKSRPSVGPRRLRPSIAPRDPEGNTTSNNVTRSNSLYQIRGLMGKMQKLEERLHTAKARLPATAQSPTRALSPIMPEEEELNMLSKVTVRSPSKRPSMLPSELPPDAEDFDPRRSRISVRSPRPPVPPKDDRSYHTLHTRPSKLLQGDGAQTTTIARPQSRLSTASGRISAASNRPGSSVTTQTGNMSSFSQSLTGHKPTQSPSRQLTSLNTGGAASVGSPRKSNLHGRPSIGGGVYTAGNTTAADTARRRSNIARPSLGLPISPERKRATDGYRPGS